jgi:hypothetical protein
MTDKPVINNDEKHSEVRRQSREVCTETASPSSAPSDSIEPEIIESGKPSLPFSKARSIALVATVTGASFLNVNIILCIGCQIAADTFLDTYGSIRRHHSTDPWCRAGHT